MNETRQITSKDRIIFIEKSSALKSKISTYIVCDMVKEIVKAFIWILSKSNVLFRALFFTRA